MDILLPKLRNAMMAQAHKNDVLANNLANINNTGFKRDIPFFEVLNSQDPSDTRLGVRVDFSQGELNKTDNPLDLAIAGKGFFTVETADGEGYLRSGHFRLDDYGVLRTEDNLPLMGEAGMIVLSGDGLTPQSVTVTADGELFVGKDRIDRLRIVDVDHPEMLKRAGGDLFVAEPGAGIHDIEETEVYQGFVEQSNVDPVREMIGLIEVQRQFESTQRMIRTLDDVFRQAASQVGQYR